MKASLARARRKVAREPDLVLPGHLVSPARVLPSRSHRLKMKKPPTGTKYFCQPWPEKDWELKTFCHLRPHRVAACCFRQAEPGGKDGESDQEVEESRQVEEPGPADDFPEVDLLGGLWLAGGVELALVLSVGSVELLSGDVPEQHHHCREEHGWEQSVGLELSKTFPTCKAEGEESCGGVTASNSEEGDGDD